MSAFDNSSQMMFSVKTLQSNILEKLSEEIGKQNLFLSVNGDNFF